MNNENIHDIDMPVRKVNEQWLIGKIMNCMRLALHVPLPLPSSTAYQPYLRQIMNRLTAVKKKRFGRMIHKKNLWGE
jgi:hypothetical protein